MAVDQQLPPYADSISSLAFHPTNPELLLTGSWDKNVHLHDLTTPKDVKKVVTRGSILDVAWAPSSESQFYAGGLTNEVRMGDFNSDVSTLITKHDAPVKCVEYSSSLNAILSASWDSTLRLTSPHSPTSALVIPLPAKVFSVALSKTKIVAAMGGRAVWIWDSRNVKEVLEKRDSGNEQQGEGETVQEWQKRESSLKFMTRAVRCMPNDQGYVTTSIEGRVAVEFFDPSPEIQSKKYAFKCHRQVINEVDTVYPVSGLAFNPVHGTFATGGGDSTVSLWDPAAKKRLRQYPKYPAPISALEFNCDGTKLAVAFSDSEEGGDKSEGRGGDGVIVREVGDECRPKAKA